MYDGFLFQGITLTHVAMWCFVTLALIIANELARRSRMLSLALFLILPIVLTFTLWLPRTATPGTGSGTGTWFHWVKVYSALAGCLGFLLIRYWGFRKKKYGDGLAGGTVPGTEEKIPGVLLWFPPLILALNILEACIRDFQVYGWHADGQLIDGVVMISGPWNIMNGIAGLLNILAISGWMGIRISQDRTRDMQWRDMGWTWIIAYDLWNFAYVYNCVSDHSFYAGAALLASCTIPVLFIRKNAWLQHRAQTLAFWMMFTMSVPAFVGGSRWSVQASHDPAALWTVSLLSLAVNMAVLARHVYRIIKYKRNPFKDEIYA